MTKGIKKEGFFKKLPPVDAPLLSITIVLVVFGLIMMFSASYAYAYYHNNDSFYYIKDQAFYAVFGFIVMLIASRYDYRKLHKFAAPLYILTVILLVVTLFMPPINNARRWILLPGFQFQPSEIAKFSIILLFAHMISIGYDKMKNLVYGYIQFLIYTGIVAVIMLKQPHVSGTILIMSISFVILFIGGAKIKWFLITISVAVVGGGAFLKFSNKMEYALLRIEYWLKPFSDPQNLTYQTDQSLIAIGSGGLLGRGLGNSMQKHLYVPEPQNDFVFSIVCEELGFIGAVLLILLFLYFVVRGFSIALKAKDKFGALLAVGITAQIGLQALLNIAVVTNTVPNTGISLPFFSYGGTSLVMLLAEVGVLLSVSRYSKLENK